MTKNKKSKRQVKSVDETKKLFNTTVKIVVAWIAIISVLCGVGFYFGNSHAETICISEKNEINQIYNEKLQNQLSSFYLESLKEQKNEMKLLENFIKQLPTNLNN